MSTLIFSLILATNMHVGNILTNTPNQTMDITKKPAQTQDKALEDTLKNITAASSAKQEVQPSNSMMIIEAKNRSDDLISAYNALKRDVSLSKITFHTKDDQTLTNITDISSIGNGTLLLFKTSTNRGMQYHVLATENIAKISVN